MERAEFSVTRLTLWNPPGCPAELARYSLGFDSGRHSWLPRRCRLSCSRWVVA
jgi:hypothetical protein